MSKLANLEQMLYSTSYHEVSNRANFLG